MKIALILERLDLARGGAERSTWEMAGALRDAGMDVTVIAGQVPSEVRDRQDIPVHNLAVKALTRSGWWRQFVRAVRRHLQAHPYDITHAIVPLEFVDVYQPRGGSMTHIARRHAESAGGAMRVRFKQVTGGLNFGRRARIRAEAALCRRPDGPVVTALSQYVADQFRRDYRLCDDRIALVRNGVRVERFTDPAVRQQASRLRQLCDPDRELAILLYVGANFRRKGLDWLIRAAAVALGQSDGLTDFRVLVVSPDDFTEYWQQARALGLENRFLFMGRSAELPALYAMADAVVLPTRDDACSRVVMEGLAAGTPAITTRFNGAADFLADGRYGITVQNCDDDGELARAINTLRTPGQAGQYKRRIAADRVWQTVSMARHARELIDLYRSLKR